MESNNLNILQFLEDLRGSGPLNRIGTEKHLEIVDWIRRKATYLLEDLLTTEPKSPRTTELWHPVDGKLRHLTRVTKSDGDEFYTDGVREEIPGESEHP